MLMGRKRPGRNKFNKKKDPRQGRSKNTVGKAERPKHINTKWVAEWKAKKTGVSAEEVSVTEADIEEYIINRMLDKMDRPEFPKKRVRTKSNY